MSKMVLENGVVIDDEKAVVDRLRCMSGKAITDLGVAKRFILQEKNTRIYIDSSLHSYMQKQSGCTYLWLDTGYVDQNGRGILISLVNNGSEYIGHFVGTIRDLANVAIYYFRLRRKTVSGKIATLESKYRQKAAERKTAHIEDEKEYLLNVVNGEPEKNTMAAMIESLHCEFPEYVEETEGLPVPEEEVESEKIVRVDAFSHFTESQEETTIEILLEQMEKMQGTIDQLYEEVQRLQKNSESKELEMSGMAATIEEYRRAMVMMRDYSRTESEKQEARERELAEEMPAHSLIRNRGKILVIGGENISASVMSAIAKQYGFDKNDLVFMGYHDAKNCADQIRREGRYAAVIFGACPHKTTGNGDYNSLLDKLMKTEGMPYTVDARSKSGVLKITKKSFREALDDICRKFREEDSSLSYPQNVILYA